MLPYHKVEGFLSLAPYDTTKALTAIQPTIDSLLTTYPHIHTDVWPKLYQLTLKSLAIAEALRVAAEIGLVSIKYFPGFEVREDGTREYTMLLEPNRPIASLRDTLAKHYAGVELKCKDYSQLDNTITEQYNGMSIVNYAEYYLYRRYFNGLHRRPLAAPFSVSNYQHQLTTVNYRIKKLLRDNDAAYWLLLNL